jgi:hypothetical protein
VLDGNLQHVGGRLRLTLRLVRVQDGTTLWADKFDDSFTDIFAVQDAISSQVAGALALRLSGDEKQLLAKRYTENPEAYRLYLLGLISGINFISRRPKAAEYFKQAIAKTPATRRLYRSCRQLSSNDWNNWIAQARAIRQEPRDEGFGNRRHIS